MRTVFAAISATALLAGCEPGTPSTGTPRPEERPAAKINTDAVLRVRATATGQLSVEGQPVTPEQLAAKMADLKRVNGVVWYYRENPEAEPHPNAMKVIELVTQMRLPIRLSSRPDFSDSIDGKGASHPNGWE